MEYAQIRLIHITCATLSIAGFVLRAFWMWRASPLLQAPLTRRLPHVNDTLLLAAAIALAYLSGQTPWASAWVAAKIGGLLLYILLGSIALKRGRSLSIRLAASFAAILVFAWIVSVARAHHPAGFLAWLPWA